MTRHIRSQSVPNEIDTAVTLCSYVFGATRPMRVLIADDHPIIRKGLRTILQSRSDIVVCGEAESAKEARTKAQLLKPDLMILDLSLSDSSGLTLAREIKALLPKIPIIFVSAYDGKQVREEVKKLGFQGFVCKSDAATTLLGAIDAVVF
jgi:DNA-binding NarL/FixJ family response regulator